MQILALPLANSVTLNLSPKHFISFLKIKNENDDNNTEFKVLSWGLNKVVQVEA